MTMMSGAVVAALLAVLCAPAVAAGDARGRITALGARPAGGSPDVLARLIRDELAKWPHVIKEAGIRLE